MFGWNPFKKQQQTMSTVETFAPDLASEIVRVRDDTLGQDLRPMQRLIRDTTFLLPLHEAPIQTDHGTVLRYVALDENDVMPAFSGAEALRSFERGRLAAGAQSYQTGKNLCEIAERDDLRKIVLNPGSELEFPISPMVYRTIAHGFVLGHISDEALPLGEIAVGKSVAGMPGMDALTAFRTTLSQFGAIEAWWATLFLPPDETRFCIGVSAPANAFETLPEQLVQAWIGRWPLPTPLYVFPLNGEVAARDEAFRACDQIL